MCQAVKKINLERQVNSGNKKVGVELGMQHGWQRAHPACTKPQVPVPISQTLSMMEHARNPRSWKWRQEAHM